MKTTPLTYLNENDGSGILAFGSGPTFILDEQSDLDAMQSFIDENQGAYIFTTLSYDLKVKIQGLESKKQRRSRLSVGNALGSENSCSH